MISLDEINALLPHAKLQQRAAKVAEALGKRELDTQLQIMQTQLAEVVASLVTAEGQAGVAPPPPLADLLHTAGARIVFRSPAFHSNSSERLPVRPTYPAISLSVRCATHAPGGSISSLIQDALLTTSPLLVPLCELLSLRPDGMAKHMVTKLYAALLEMAHAARVPTSQPSGMLLRAGLCLHMVTSGVHQVEP